LPPRARSGTHAPDQISPAVRAALTRPAARKVHDSHLAFRDRTAAWTKI